jgi:thiol:disulfide interchange protein DsbC
MRLTRVFSAVALGLAGCLAHAATPDDAIRGTLKSMQLDVPIEAIQESPMPGLYQVQLEGGRILYASPDGQFVLQGYLFQVKDGKGVNLTQKEEARGVASLINALPAKDLVIFAPAKPKTHITVFTDTDCGYCQKLHSEVPELNRLGVEVRYAAFPRQGPGSHGYNTLVSVWCAADRKQAMNLAKARKDIPTAQCENPVLKQFELGQRIGVNGTPAIVLANGQLIPGYQPAPELAKLALQAK